MHLESGPACNLCRCAVWRTCCSNMISSRVQFQIWLVTASFIMAIPRLAKGDGGVIRLRETQGPFSVTVFTSPEAAAGGLADLSVLVQGSESGKVVLDAYVTFTLSPPVGEMK